MSDHTNPLYFLSFDSYNSTVNGSKGVSINVTLIDGSVHSSSPIPIEHIEFAYEQVARFEERMPVILWDGASNSVMTFHADKILSMALRMK